MVRSGRPLAVRVDYSIPISEKSSTPVITLSPEPSPLPQLNDGDLVQLSMDRAGIDTYYIGNNEKKMCV